MKYKQSKIVYLFFCFYLCAVLTASAHENHVSIQTDDTYRYITANGIPDHAYGRFPNSGNPNSVSPQNYSFRVPLNPKLSGKTEFNPLGSFGVALNGVPFDPGAAEFWQNDRSSGWQYEALSGKINLGMDQNNAHVQPTGAYHYHGLSGVLLKRDSKTGHSKLIGYAADGFPVYAAYGFVDPQAPEKGSAKMKPGYVLKRGQRRGGPGGAYDGTFVEDYEFAGGSGDLDECNGRFGITPEYPQGIYHYFLTEKFPFIPRCFKGTPDSSFAHRGGGRQPQGQGMRERGGGMENGRPGGRHPDLKKAAAKLGISFDALRRAMGPPPPDFSQAARTLGISESRLREAVQSS